MNKNVTSLSARLADQRLLVAVGVFDALSAVLAQRHGFEAVFVSGSALGYTQLGRPDVGMLTATELAGVVGRVGDAVDIPILVDADHGFGNAINVYRTVQLLERAGASGIQLEDQQESAPPADMQQRPLVSTTIMADKIRAAVDARASTQTIISARTDALRGCGMAEALERADRYIEAGADMIFVEGCTTNTARHEVASRLANRTPLLFNAGILDAAQLPGPEDFEQLGYTVILFPRRNVAAAARAMQSALADLQVWAGGKTVTRPVDLDTAIEADAFLAKFV